MSKLAPAVWSALDKLFTDKEHEELLSILLEDETGDKIRFFVHESLPEDHSDEEYEDAVKSIELLSRTVTDNVAIELLSIRALLAQYPVLAQFFTAENTEELLKAFLRKEELELSRADYYVGVYLLAKAEELQDPEFDVKARLA